MARMCLAGPVDRWTLDPWTSTQPRSSGRTVGRSSGRPPWSIARCRRRPPSTADQAQPVIVEVVTTAGAVTVVACAFGVVVKRAEQRRCLTDAVRHHATFFLAGFLLAAFVPVVVALRVGLAFDTSSRSPVIVSALPAAMALHFGQKSCGCEPVVQALPRFGTVTVASWLRH